MKELNFLVVRAHVLSTGAFPNIQNFEVIFQTMNDCSSGYVVKEGLIMADKMRNDDLTDQKPFVANKTGEPAMADKTTVSDIQQSKILPDSLGPEHIAQGQKQQIVNNDICTEFSGADGLAINYILVS